VLQVVLEARNGVLALRIPKSPICSKHCRDLRGHIQIILKDRSGKKSGTLWDTGRRRQRIIISHFVRDLSMEVYDLFNLNSHERQSARPGNQDGCRELQNYISERDSTHSSWWQTSAKPLSNVRQRRLYAFCTNAKRPLDENMYA
jgi:hypothetical protein